MQENKGLLDFLGFRMTQIRQETGNDSNLTMAYKKVIRGVSQVAVSSPKVSDSHNIKRRFVPL